MPPHDTAALGTLLTESRNPASEHLDQLSTLDMLRLINDEDATVASAVRAELPNIARAVDAIAERFSRGGRLFYIGAGTSGRLGVLDASECPPTFSVPADLVQGLIAGGDPALRLSSEHSEDSPELGAEDLAAAGFAALVPMAKPTPTPSSASPPAAARPMSSAPSPTPAIVEPSPSASAASPTPSSPAPPRSPSPPPPAPRSSPAPPASRLEPQPSSF